jgi:ABC-2 type transport system ATP-binding protein
MRQPDQVLALRPGQPVLEVANVEKTYGTVRALANVSLTIRSGEIIGLVGPNGAGKSTLAEVISGLVRPDAGQVSICGVDMLREPQQAQRGIALASQEIGIYPNRSVQANLTHFGRLAGLTPPYLSHRVAEIMDRLDLGSLRRRAGLALSGGERRRLHVGIALLAPRPLMFLDEPTANVDIDSRGTVLGLVKELAAAGSGVCYATHYLSEVEKLDARVVMLDRGRVVAAGRASTLVDQHGVTVIEIALAKPLSRVPSIPGSDVVASDTQLTVTTRSAPPGVGEIAAIVADCGGLPQSVEVRQPSLESVYLSLKSAGWPSLPAQETGWQ